jgi:hypothetical protein
MRDMSGTGDDDRSDEDRAAEGARDATPPAHDAPTPEDRSGEGNEDQVNPAETEQFEEFREDLDAVERRIAGEIDPGVRAMVVAGAVFLLLVSLVLPHTGGARGRESSSGSC